MSETRPLSTYPDLGDRVYHLIREQILTGQMPPGSLLLGVELAREIGVSRTPVADALNVLAAEGLVQVLPRRGYFVASLDRQAYTDLMDARLALELAAVERAMSGPNRPAVTVLEKQMARLKECVDENGVFRDYQEWVRRDMQFHELLVESAANPYLSEIYLRLSARVQLANVHFSLSGRTRPARDAAAEHADILAAFAARDLGALRAALERHVAHSVAFYGPIAAERAPAPVADAPLEQPAASRRLRWLTRTNPSKA